MPTYIILGVVLVAAALISAGCATKRPMRPTHDAKGDPDTNVVANADAWYIVSKPTDGSLPYSCSFVEFDERGDYLDFRQQKRSWEKIQELAVDEHQKLVFVIYCHGWKNNSQSGNVLEFNHFLGRLAASPEIRERHLRVHGLYLGWRGNVVKQYVDTTTEAFRQTTNDFGGPIVDTKYSRWLSMFTPLWLAEQVSYWSRKGAAESKVSGVPLARTIFTAANAAKHFSGPDWTNRVFVIGHSFGALMLEKALGQACVGALTDQWKWSESKETNALPATTSTLPFDLMLFVNSAAPSIYAKELADLLWAHQNAQQRSRAQGARAPIIISLTSSADWATKKAHRWANVLAPFYPSLQRDYTEGVLEPSPHIPVPQSYFYEHTPGHNPLLVDHWIKQLKDKDFPAKVPSNNPFDVFADNLSPVTPDPTIFYTTAEKGDKPLAWRIGIEPDPPGWSQYKGHQPVKRGNYWVVRCTKPLIASHDAIWTTTAMDMYAALYRLTEVERRETVGSPKN